MVDLALASKELDEIVEKRALLRAKYVGAVMPDEASQEDREMVTRAAKLRRVIEEGEQARRDHEFEELTNYIASPKYQVPKSVNPDDASRKELAKAGWETKGGYVCRMTSLGREIAMYPEEVLWGPLPSGNDPGMAAVSMYFRQMRNIFQPEYRRAYSNWIMNKSRNDGAAFSQLASQEQNALSEGSDGAGGYLVPPDVQAEMLARVAQEGVMRSLCRVVPTSRDKIEYPAVAPNSTSGSIYSSGFVGGWVGETPAFVETDPGFQNFEVSIKDLQVSTKMSNNWLDDAAVNVLAWLAQNGAENMALVEDSGFIAGLGTAFQPRGVLESGIDTVDVEGTTSNHVSNTIADPGSAPKITDLEYALPAQYSANATHLMARSTEGRVRKLVDANARPLWGSAFTGTPREIDGYPVRNSDFVPVGGTNANKVMVFGDFRNYIIGQRAAISTVVLRERFADNRQTGIILFERVGGGVWNTDAFRIGIV